MSSQRPLLLLSFFLLLLLCFFFLFRQQHHVLDLQETHQQQQQQQEVLQSSSSSSSSLRKRQLRQQIQKRQASSSSSPFSEKTEVGSGKKRKSSLTTILLPWGREGTKKLIRVPSSLASYFHSSSTSSSSSFTTSNFTNLFSNGKHLLQEFQSSTSSSSTSKLFDSPFCSSSSSSSSSSSGCLFLYRDGSKETIRRLVESADGVMIDSVALREADISALSLLPARSSSSSSSAESNFLSSFRKRGKSLILHNTENLYGRRYQWQNKWRTRWLNLSVPRILVSKGEEEEEEEEEKENKRVTSTFWNHFDLVSSYEEFSDARILYAAKDFSLLSRTLSEAGIITRHSSSSALRRKEKKKREEEKRQKRQKSSSSKSKESSSSSSSSTLSAIFIASNCHTYLQDAFNGNRNRKGGKANNINRNELLQGKAPKHRDELVKNLKVAGLKVDSFGACLNDENNNHQGKRDLSSVTSFSSPLSAQEEVEKDDESWTKVCSSLSSFSSSSSSTNNKQQKKNKNSKKLKKYCVMKNYLFSLAFENSQDFDYVTEKLYEPLALSVIPVYVGAPNIRDLLPADHSAILFSDFDYDAKKLVKYLRCLSSNSSLIRYYQNWRDRVDCPEGWWHREVEIAQEQEQNFALCKICQGLTNNNNNNKNNRLRGVDFFHSMIEHSSTFSSSTSSSTSSNLLLRRGRGLTSQKPLAECFDF